MKASCLDEKGQFKRCPFMIVEQEQRNASGAHKVQNFRPCIGEKCIAYHEGKCLRLPMNETTDGEEFISHLIEALRRYEIVYKR